LLFPPSLVGCAPRCCRDCWKLCIATFHEDSVMWRYLNPDWYFCPANESDRRRFRRWVFDHPRLCWQRSKPAYQPSPIDLPQSLPDMFLNPALHLHCVCAKLFLSFIGHASFYDEIWWSGNQPYLTMKRGFFYPTLEALWNPRHSQGFSNTIKKTRFALWQTPSYQALFTLAYIMPCMSPPMPPMPPMSGAPPDSSGIWGTTASVVKNIAATEAAFCCAERVTFVGSMIPASTMFTQLLVAASKPTPPSSPFKRSTTIEPSRPAFSAI